MTPQKKLLITGGSGYLGRCLTAKAAGQFDLFTTYNSRLSQVNDGQAWPLDLTNRDAVYQLVTELKPDAIIHAAAVNPGRGDEALMMRVNGDGSRYVAEAAGIVKARLVHVSTDALHDGKKAPYADEDPPNPLNAYGRSKAAGEAAVIAAYPEAAIVRTSLIYGLEEIDRGTEDFANYLEVEGELTLFEDVIRQPIWVNNLSDALLKMIDIRFSGFLNVAGRQPLTRAAFGLRMLEWWGINTAGRTRMGQAAAISDKIPLDLSLSITKAELLLGMRLLGVDEVLADAIN